MTRNYSEEDSVKKGLASLAVALGASEGDVAQIDADGNVTLAPGNGGSSPFVGGTLTEPTVVDAPAVLSNGGIDRVFGVIDPDHETTIDWLYDGATNLTATISGGYPGVYATLNANDDDSSVPHGYFDNSGDLVLAITNVGFESGGPDFVAHVHVPIGQLADVATSQAFSVGTAANRTVIYKAASLAAVPGGTVFRGSVGIWGGTSGSRVIWITAAEVPGDDGSLGQPIFIYSSADGATSRFAINRFGGITITTSDSSPPITLPNLPTVDPVIAGALWNDGNTVKVSTG